MTDETHKWREKVEALMRKAEDPATSQAERDSITEKVTYLMTKYGIEEAMLSYQKTQTFTVLHRNIVVNAPYVNKKGNLLNCVAVAMGCFIVQTADGKFSIFGTVEDIERTLMLYYSIILQMTSALGTAQVHKPAWEHGKTFNGSFVNGFIRAVSLRIIESAKRAKADVRESDAGSGMELVLVKKDELVRNAVSTVFPRLRTIRSATRSGSSSGYNQGQSAGQRADLGGSRIGSTGRRAIGG